MAHTLPTQKGTRPMLTVAARSIAAASGAPVDELLSDRALRHYGEGLRQYLAIRTGSLPRAERAFAQLRSRAAEASLGDPPGPRARLYRLARDVASKQGPPEQGAKLPWRPPREGLAPEVPIRLRRGLTENDAELLELRHARELSPEEIAFVLGQSVDRTLAELEEAATNATSLVDAVGVPLRAVLLQAFALEPRNRLAPAATGDERAAFAPGTVIGMRYAVQQRVGTGAFGDVYQARDTEVEGHVVALKILHSEARTQQARADALRELHLIASVFHPSVVQFKDHGWHEGRLWFVMPWYEGETLEQRIQRQPLSRGEARRIFEPLARALATIHAAGIRHQDVKPDNIFLARIPGFGGRNGGEQVLPVLLDLGVAAKEAEMVVAGTPTYFAPEVAAQFAEVEPRPLVGPKADVFALALSLRNALEPDTQPDVPAGAIEAFVKERARTAPPGPAARELRFLGPSLRRWMSLDPEERPSADALADELAVLTRPEERRRRVTSVLRWVAPMALALVAIFGAVTYGLHTRAERQQLRAERARQAERGLREDLHLSKARRRALETRVRSARREYARSRMSREQLAQELARLQGEREVAAERARALETRTDRLAGDLKATKRDLAAREQTLATTRQDLTAARADAERAAARGARLATQVEAARDELERTQDRVASLEGEVDGVRARLGAEQAKSAELERQVARATAARARAEAELARMRQPTGAPEGAPDRQDEAGAPGPAEAPDEGPADSESPPIS